MDSNTPCKYLPTLHILCTLLRTNIALFNQVKFNGKAKFTNNYTSGGAGGAIDVDANGKAIFRKVIFDENGANGSSTDGNGGAIFTEGKIKFRKDTFFTSNFALGEILMCVCVFLFLSSRTIRWMDFPTTLIFR